MTLQKVVRIALIIAAVDILLMVIFRHSQSEMYTILSMTLAGTIFFTFLYYMYTTERIKPNPTLTKYKYLFFGITIPLLLYGVEVTRQTDGFLKNGVRVLLLIAIFYLLFSFVIKKWRNYQKLKSEKTKAELTLLKEQINPHFFFNTLNNLYSLIKKDADAAQDYVLKLSDLMRFTIYDSGKEKVRLKDEIDYLINYIDLQTGRFHREIDIDFSKKINNPNEEVAPLLFIILLENAFKHGVEKATENTFIHLRLTEDDKKIRFVVKNNFDVDESSKTKGIGLENLKTRLELLYPDRHQLILKAEKDIYTAALEILKK